jgi:hypothetical protein
MEVTQCQVWVVWEMVQYLPGYEVQYVLDSAGHLETGVVVQHGDTLMSMPECLLLLVVQRSQRIPQ